jgi:hypothetical protein
MHPTETLDLPDQHDYEAEEAMAHLVDLPDATLEALADAAAWDARCEAHEWRMALALAGHDAWVCERLALAGGGV